VLIESEKRKSRRQPAKSPKFMKGGLRKKAVNPESGFQSGPGDSEDAD